jgi:hypothetical protein
MRWSFTAALLLTRCARYPLRRPGPVSIPTYIRTNRNEPWTLYATYKASKHIAKLHAHIVSAVKSLTQLMRTVVLVSTASRRRSIAMCYQVCSWQSTTVCGHKLQTYACMSSWLHVVCRAKVPCWRDGFKLQAPVDLCPEYGHDHLYSERQTERQYGRQNTNGNQFIRVLVWAVPSDSESVAANNHVQGLTQPIDHLLYILASFCNASLHIIIMYKMEPRNVQDHRKVSTSILDRLVG